MRFDSNSVRPEVKSKGNPMTSHPATVFALAPLIMMPQRTETTRSSRPIAFTTTTTTTTATTTTIITLHEQTQNKIIFLMMSVVSTNDVRNKKFIETKGLTRTKRVENTW